MDSIQTPVLATEEYIEQTYFFRLFRERLADGRPSGEILEHLQHELLSTTRLPLAVSFVLSELKHTGMLHSGFENLPHYFTPFQTHVISQTESDRSRLTLPQALSILEREAEYKSQTPTPAGLFVYQMEAIARNQLGYLDSLEALAGDAIYEEDWYDFIYLVRRALGEYDLATLIYRVSEYYVSQRQQQDPDYESDLPILFPLREGRIASANINKEPMYFFAALQRQLKYPEVPRPPKADQHHYELEALQQRVNNLEQKIQLLQNELSGNLDPNLFLAKPPTKASNPAPKPWG